MPKPKTLLLIAASIFGLGLILPSSVLAAGCATAEGCLQQSPFVNDLNTIVDSLSAGVGLIVTGVIIWSGIEYMIAGDNSNKVTAAKGRLINALFALIAFGLTWAFLQWLIPGGIFK